VNLWAGLYYVTLTICAVWDLLHGGYPALLLLPMLMGVGGDLLFGLKAGRLSGFELIFRGESLLIFLLAGFLIRLLLQSRRGEASGRAFGEAEAEFDKERKTGIGIGVGDVPVVTGLLLMLPLEEAFEAILYALLAMLPAFLLKEWIKQPWFGQPLPGLLTPKQLASKQLASKQLALRKAEAAATLPFLPFLLLGLLLSGGAAGG